jgi:hypothetical protein
MGMMGGVVSVVVATLIGLGACQSPPADRAETRTDEGAVESRPRRPRPSVIVDGAPPIPPSRAETVWNVWAEENTGPGFTPTQFLRPKTEYRLMLDLASVAYRRDGVTSRNASADFQQEAIKWVEQGRRDVTLRVVLLQGAESFERVAKPVESLKVDLVRMREAPNSVEGDPFVKLRENPDAKFEFGRVSFAVKTRAVEGPATVGLSIWADSRPVDQLAATLCVATDANAAQAKCPAVPEAASLLKGIDSLRVAAEGAAAFPDAALHFVEVRRSQVFGVLWRKTEPDTFLTWPLSAGPKEIADYVANPVLPTFFKAATGEALSRIGAAFYALLFPNEPGNEDAVVARKAFEQFVASAPRNDPAAKLPVDFTPPSIFVRTVMPSQPNLMVPVGLMFVADEFVGFSFRIEQPLPFQSYVAFPGCVGRWVMVLPPDPSGDADLKDARTAVAKRINGWQPVDIRMKPVGDWLMKGPVSDPLAFFVTSHHDSNTIYFEDGDPILSKNIQVQFTKPSLAVLNGCGTGGPGATDIIKELSRRGMVGVIATATQVKGEMAGSFLECLAGVMDDPRSRQGLSLGQVHFASVRCLRKMTGHFSNGPYDARALSYMLLGNGSVSLCQPAKRGR